MACDNEIMPGRNIVRQFMEDASYHCYNRGVEKRQIFMDAQDYGVFLNRLKRMLSDPEELRVHNPDRDRLKSFYGDVELIAYCLMPNHFHLLLHQDSKDGIAEFMRTLSTSYTMYFNKRYERVGSLFQGTYKARIVDAESYNMHISRYIHLNPLSGVQPVERYPYSSMLYYKDARLCPDWVKPSRVMELFDDSYDKYAAFVSEYTSIDDFTELHDQYTLE